MSKNPENDNIEGENVHIFEFSRKDVTYDDIQNHKKPGLHPFSEKHIFGKTTGVVK